MKRPKNIQSGSSERKREEQYLDSRIVNQWLSLVPLPSPIFKAGSILQSQYDQAVPLKLVISDHKVNVFPISKVPREYFISAILAEDDISF